MQLKPWTAFLGVTAIAIQGTAATEDNAQNGTIITVLGPTKLQEPVGESFLACLNYTSTDESGTPYMLYIDQGATVVHPSSNRTIDFEGPDEPLLGCMQHFASNMSLVAEDWTVVHEYDTGSIPAARANVSWLVEQGAQGLHPVGTKLAGISSLPSSDANETDTTTTTLEARDGDQASSSQLAARSFSHYWAFLSDYKKCASEDFQVKYAGECHNYNSKFKSVQFENPSGSLWLEMEIWPHHRCIKGNGRKMVIYPLEMSECHTRDTYSLFGRFRGKKIALAWLSSSSNL